MPGKGRSAPLFSKAAPCQSYLRPALPFAGRSRYPEQLQRPVFGVWRREKPWVKAGQKLPREVTAVSAGRPGGGWVGAGWRTPFLPCLSLASGILLKYLQEQNRPYSAQDVFGNLQREHGLGKTVRTLSWGSGTTPGTLGVLHSPGRHFSPGLPKACWALPPFIGTSFRLPKSLSWLLRSLASCQAVVKALEQLAQQGKIKEKMYGKQKIYFADQVRETD